MFNRILAPLDGSTLAECVLPHALSLSKAYEAEITLARVVEASSGPTGEAVDPLDWELSKAEAEAYLDHIRERLKKRGLNHIKTILLEGQPAQRLIEYIEEDDFDLVILSSHGSTGISQWNVSSVVRKVVQGSNRSIMIVRAYSEAEKDASNGVHYNRLFVPLDGSLRAEYALDTAIILSRFYEAKVILGHVIARPDLPSQVPLAKDDEALIERYVQRVEDLIQEYFDSLQTRIPVELETRLKISDEVAISLHEMVEAENVDLVVLSAHGQTGQSKWPFGGITNGFIEHGTTPLMIVQDLNPDEVETTKAEAAAKESQGH